MSDAPTVEGERTVSGVAPKSKLFTRRQKGALFVLGGAAVCGVLIFTSSGKKASKEYVPPLRFASAQTMAVPQEPKPAPAVVSAAAPAVPQRLVPQQAMTMAPATPAAAPKLLIYSNAAADRGAAPGSAQVAAAGGDNGGLASALKPTLLEGASASLMPHPALTIAQGRSLPCVMQTAIDSQLPGFATCVVPYDIAGETDARGVAGVTLLDRGTQVFGEVRSGEQVHHGQNRIFVLWTRARTPKGVVISLASPATDAVGRSGVEGEVDTHWWSRFGNALLFTMIDGGAQIASSALSKGGTYLNLNSASSVATETLRNGAMIPPTITVHQGEEIGITVARDLSFEKIYGLALTRGQR